MLAKRCRILFLFLCAGYVFSIHTENIQADQIIRPIQPWRVVQDQIKDTVVQVFAMIAQFDWREPYRTPNQHATRGSGFFINHDGELITNAHVVDQAVAVWIQIPSLGKRPIKAKIISICPERDIALLGIDEDEIKYVKETLGEIPFLPLGNSDDIKRADEVLALGYPLGQQSLKSTTGIISGREQHLIQISAPINPGSSGGPLLNMDGKVIGINSSGIVEAQNVGYAIPVNSLKVILSDLYNVPLLRKPFLGILSIKVNEETTRMLGNPEPGGCYVVEAVKNSPLERAGILSGDMIYEINGHKLDIYGDMSVDWSEDKISFADYIGRLALGEEAHLVIYRYGERKEFTVTIDNGDVTPVSRMFPWFEEIDYEVFGGMVVMQLTLNHIRELREQAPGLKLFSVINSQAEPTLVISHIFPNSELARIQSIAPGFTINEINDTPVKNLDEFREALYKSLKTGFLSIKTTDQVTRASDNVLAVLSFKSVCKELIQLSRMYRYPISSKIKQLLIRAGIFVQDI